jgi:hypothetical protein
MKEKRNGKLILFAENGDGERKPLYVPRMGS